MFSLLLQVRDSRVVGSGVTFSISSALKKNIRKYGIAALLTPNLSRYYKGPCVKVVLDIIKAHRFDLPPDIEKDRARWQLVESEVKEQLTSLKGTMKNTLGKSLSTAEEDAVDILTLGIALVGSSEIKLTVRHLAQIAFLRAVLAEHGVADTKYWPAVDKKLAKLREDAGKDKFKESQVFKRTLENDLAKYGHPTAEAGAAQSQLPAWQEDVERLFD
ncbi:hypothetical protein BOTBODRAFT_279762 [Botryobasidium botryosum FD-172 SS1]|uniref:Uncharacterized protein n=1 Tax=Botryobasidium botryosum (strain FD-172 SS1) TaxID=930990 RepID=A0A067M238_BOTB1|nr:hypothetical protein BOTBODRAFT_279762 [Botryobasidium botryosum FD-172 SS1]